MKFGLRNISINKEHVRLIFFLGIAIIISVNTVMIINKKSNIQNESFILSTYENIDCLEKINAILLEAESEVFAYYITSDTIYMSKYQTAFKSTDSLYRVLRKNIASSKSQLLLDTLSEYLNERFALYRQNIEIYKRNHGSRRNTININKSKAVQSEIIRIINSIIVNEKNSLAVKIEITKTSLDWSVIIIAVGTILGIGIVVWIFFVSEKKSADFYHDPNSPQMSPQELESLVKQRTAEISQINKRLYDEIEKHKQTELKLVKRELDFHSLFEQANDAIIIVETEQNKILNVNKRACEIYNIEKDNFAGINYTVLCKNVQVDKELFQNTIKLGYQQNIQSVHYKRDGSEILTEINASLIAYENQKAILLIIRDITDRIINIHFES